MGIPWATIETELRFGNFFFHFLISDIFFEILLKYLFKHFLLSSSSTAFQNVT
jgi:hypothetical protein